MSLTQAEKEQYREIIQNTNTHHNTQRVIPEDYAAYMDQVDRQEMTLPLDPPAAPVRLVISTAKDKQPGFPIHINMHGGGFVHPQDGDDDLYCAHLAAGIQGMVVDIDYATSWEHPFPCAFEQCYAVVQWVFAQCQGWGGDPSRISVGGHSAGGCLSAAIAMRAAATKDFALCLQVLDYSALDNYQAVLPGGNPRSMAFSRLYADGDDRVLQLPFCSPAFATDEMLRDLPPALVINGGSCPFKKDNEAYALRMAAQGNEVTIKCFMNSPHGFTIRMAGEWREAQDLIIRAVRQAKL